MSVNLPPRANVSKVAALKVELTAALGNGEPVSIDTSAVESIDTATLQLLFAFRREADAQGIEIQWGEIAPTVRSTARILGFDHQLMGWGE
ncbi:MAG: STAS domain-containing protein [Pseudomonadota bacterium]